MPKINLEELTKAEKKHRLNVWVKDSPIIEIGSSHYQVEPQPARAVLQFQNLIQLYVDYAAQYKDLMPQRGTEEKAEEQEAKGTEKAEEQEPRDWIKEVRGLVETLVESPYHLLKPFVPDLEKEDAEAAPWGQVWHNLGVLAEINGLGWGEELLKKYIAPFVPDLLRSVLTLGTGAAKARVSLGKSGLGTSTSPSTTSEASPTDSTPEEP